MRAGQIKRIGLSTSPAGRPIIVTDEVTVLHTMTADDASDAVFVEVFNGEASQIGATLIVCPLSASAVDIASASVPFVVPAQNQRLIIEGHEVRREPGAPYQVAMQAEAGKTLHVFGYVVRRSGPAEVA